tara:strand:+ start:3975 stop:4574 length:600 start_codon:yes stop_codon:yes gene_type:complete
VAKKGSLFINIGARVDGFKKGLDRSMRMLRGYKKRISRMMPTLPGGVVGALGMGMGAAGVMGMLMNASPKFAKEIAKLTDMVAPLAGEIGDKLAPVVAQFAEMLPGLVSNLIEFGSTLVQAYTDLQKKAEEIGGAIGEEIGKLAFGDPNKGISREELQELRGIKDELIKQGKSGNATAVDNEFKGGARGVVRAIVDPII